MKNIFFSTLLTFLLIFSSASAQNNGSLTWGNTYNEKLYYVGDYQYIKGGNSYYILMTHDGIFTKSDLHIVRLDTITMATKKIIPLPYQMKKIDLNYYDMQVVNNKLVVYFTKLNTKGKNTYEFVKQVYDFDLKPIGDLTIISNSPTFNEFIDEAFMMKNVNEDLQEGEILKANQSKTALIIDRYDKEFKELKNSTTYKISSFYNGMTLGGFQFDKTGDACFIAAHPLKAFTKIKTASFTLNKLTKSDEIIKVEVKLAHEIKSDDLKYWFHVTPDKSVGFIYGIYEFSKNCYLFINKYNLEDLSLVGHQTINLGKGEEKGLSSSDFFGFSYSFTDLRLQVPIVDDLGNVHLVGEFIQYPSVYKDSKTNGTSGNIVHIIFDKNVVHKFTNVIPRNQKIKETSIQNASYLYGVSGTSVKFVFYDEPKNLNQRFFDAKNKPAKSDDNIKGDLFVVTYNDNGEIVKEQLSLNIDGNAHKMNKKNNFNIRSSFYLGNNKFIVGYESNIGLLKLNK